MSSHHFVKEFQEPSVFIYSAHAADFDRVGPLLEWSPFVVVSDLALGEVREWGIKIDAIVLQPMHLDLVKAIMGDPWNLEYLEATAPDQYLAAVSQRIASGSGDLHIVDTAEQLPPEYLIQTNKGRHTLYHAHYRWVSPVGGLYHRWWPQGITLRLHYPVVADIHLEGEYIRREKGQIHFIKESFIRIHGSEGSFLVGEPY
jgi:hypothetical protein